MKTSNVLLFDAVNGGSTQQSSAFTAGFMQNFTVHAINTSTASGTLVIQGSNDQGSPSNWADIANTSAVVSSAAPYLKSISNQPYEYIRLSYSSASGSGSLSARIKACGYF